MGAYHDPNRRKQVCLNNIIVHYDIGSIYVCPDEFGSMFTG